MFEYGLVLILILISDLNSNPYLYPSFRFVISWEIFKIFFISHIFRFNSFNLKCISYNLEFKFADETREICKKLAGK